MHMYIKMLLESGVTIIMHDSPNGRVNYHILFKKGWLPGNSHLWQAEKGGAGLRRISM